MLLYIGAGTDMSPLLLPHENEFVFLDQCPMNSTGHMGMRRDAVTGNYVPIPYHNFYKNIRQNLRRLGFRCLYVQKTREEEWEFVLSYETRQIHLLYFVNTVYPKWNDRVASVVSCTSNARINIRP